MQRQPSGNSATSTSGYNSNNGGVSHKGAGKQSSSYNHHGMKYERRRDARLTKNDLLNFTIPQFVEVAKDKWKSRSLQRSLMESDTDVCKLIFEKTEPVFVHLLSDQYGNYLSQKILEHCSDDQFDLLFGKVKDNLNMLASEVHGTRAVQKFVEEGVRRGRTEQILNSLLHHVLPLSRSVTGFHVVVKLLEKLPSSRVHEVLDQLCKDEKGIITLGKDQWGCCVLKSCIDKAEDDCLKKIVNAAITHSLDLIQDPYGNYVIQHLLLKDDQVDKDLILTGVMDHVKDHVLDLCQQKFSSNVLEKILTVANDPTPLVEGVLNAGGLEPKQVVEHLLLHQYGNYVLQQTLNVAPAHLKTRLLDAVRPMVHSVLLPVLDHTKQVPTPSKLGISGALQPEQATRLCTKMAKKFNSLLDGFSEQERLNLLKEDDESSSGNRYNNGLDQYPHNYNPYHNPNMQFNQHLLALTAYQSLMAAYNPYSNPYMQQHYNMYMQSMASHAAGMGQPQQGGVNGARASVENMNQTMMNNLNTPKPEVKNNMNNMNNMYTPHTSASFEKYEQQGYNTGYWPNYADAATGPHMIQNPYPTSPQQQ